MQWVLPSLSARRPSAVRDALWFPQVIWAHEAREGKVGENPLTYKEALRKEKVRKNLWHDVGCPRVPLTPKTAEWQAFISHPLWRAIQRGNNGET
jgi:hypothetical protein